MAIKQKRERNCAECSKAPPVLWTENTPIYNCLMVCTCQLRAGFSGPYALDFGVIARVADDMGIVTDRAFWSMVRECETIVIDSYRDKTKR